MSMSSVTIEIKSCRILGTLESHENDGTGSVCQIDLELNCENAARVLNSIDPGPMCGPHNHYDHTSRRTWDALRQMAARHNAYAEPLPYERL